MKIANVMVDLSEQTELDIPGDEIAELNALELSVVGGGMGVVTPI